VDPNELAAMARAIRERLEVNRLFGWSVPLSASSLRVAHPGSAQRGKPVVGPPRESPALRDEAAPGAAARFRPPASPDVDAAALARTPAADPATWSPERARREALLAPQAAEAAACTACGLCRERTQAVFGVGDPTSRILFVGEAPGYDEDRLGEPFVGKAGQLLNDMLRAMGLARSSVYIANAVKCRPPRNRTPDAAEVAACWPFLERQADIIRPEVIVALGSVAAKALLRTEAPLGRLRGRFHEWKGLPVLPTYHPAYLLRNPEDKRKVWEDLQLVMGRLGLSRP